ncbi:hypothetical protein [Paracoccus angustae]|uniref:hypothetical protein n=1 Tax=Paracoccus angustae TaxID=1671480 RepID=UPI0036705587
MTNSMSQDECARHRSRIGFEVEVVLQGYWQEQLAPELKAAVLADWADELEDWHLEQVRWGLREWRRENPRRKPNPGDIVAVLKKRRGEEYAARAAALPKPGDVQPVITEEARARNAARVAELFPSIIKRIPEVKE